MYAPAGVKTSKDFPIPDMMKAWVLGDPGQLMLKDKPVPVPKKAEVLVRIDAVAIRIASIGGVGQVAATGADRTTGRHLGGGRRGHSRT